MAPHWIRLLLPGGGSLQLSSFGAALALGVLGAWYALVWRSGSRQRMESVGVGFSFGALAAGGVSVVAGGGAPLLVLAGASLGAWLARGESTDAQARRVVLALGTITIASHIGVYLDGSVLGRPAELPEWLAVMGRYPETSHAARLYSHVLHPISMYHAAITVGLVGVCLAVKNLPRQLALLLGGSAIAHLALAPLTHGPPRGEIALATLLLSIASVILWAGGSRSRVQRSQGS